MKLSQQLLDRLVFLKARVFIFVLLLGMLPGLANAGKDWDITYAEPLNIIQLASQLKANARVNSSDANVGLTLSAFGKTFTLFLQVNQHLIDSLNNLKVPAGVQLYTGEIENIPGSWVRLTYSNGQYIGAIYDGVELYLIDSSASALSALGQSFARSLSGPIMYKASDIKSSMSCGLSGKSAQSFSYKQLVNELQYSTGKSAIGYNAAAAGTLQKINLDIVADTEYADKVSGDPRTAILSQMNVVDGIFVEQVGVRIAVNNIDVLNDNGNLDTRDSEALLQRFRSYVGNSNPGIAHLFSGKGLDGGGTLGIAYMDAICSNWGVGVTHAGGRGIGGALTVAHEFGHNFGAPHDNQGGSACRNESGQWLMNPYFNNSDQFSQCSLDQMNRMIAEASCLQVVDGGDNGGGDNGGGDNGGGNDADKDVLSTTKNTYQAGESVVVQYYDGTGSNQDWIAIFKKGDITSSCDRNDTYVAWKYTNGNNGTVSFDDLNPGEYEAQLFIDDGYCFYGKTISFTIEEGGNDNGGDNGGDNGDNDTLSTTKSTYPLGEDAIIQYRDGSGSDQDWVGIFKQGDLTSSCQQNDSYVAWKYTNGNAGTLSFADLNAGNYQAQLFSDNGYCFIGTSVKFSVVDNGGGDDGGNDNGGNDNGGNDNGGNDNGGGDNGGDNGNASVSPLKSKYKAGETIQIRYEGGTGSNKDWIGIFKKGRLNDSCQENEDYVAWAFTNGNAGTLSFDGIGKGKYEVQMFSDDGYCYLGEGASFKVRK